MHHANVCKPLPKRHVCVPQVKLVKFLVNDVVVDVSFETLGGLCAVNFLSELDLRIGHHGLFKRSVILVSIASRMLASTPVFTSIA